MTLKTTLAVAAAVLIAVGAWALTSRLGHSEPKSQIDQIEVGRS